MTATDFRTERALERASVIWISGFSAAGKTSVARRVESKLRDQGIPVLFLDGDDLRSILAGRWGYTREERVDLARVYFRLCSHLSSQGLTVVIAAVAMYDDVRQWLKENLPGAVEVFLDVPEEERLRRDRATKQIYDELGSAEAMYDHPKSPDLVVRNHGDVSVEAAADEIVAHVARETLPRDVDHGRSEHWRRFYGEARVPQSPSTFAVAVADRIAVPARVLDVGCGNGRDASFFASRGLEIVGLDVSEAAIALCRETYSLAGLSFLMGDITDVAADAEAFDVVYSRFSLHAMTPTEEDDFIAHSARRLRAGGRLLVEARSINDPLSRKGEVLSKTERIHGHYRRFIVLQELVAKLEQAGFRVEDAGEEAGVAKLGDDNPVVIRLDAWVRG